MNRAPQHAEIGGLAPGAASPEAGNGAGSSSRCLDVSSRAGSPPATCAPAGHAPVGAAFCGSHHPAADSVLDGWAAGELQKQIAFRLEVPFGTVGSIVRRARLRGDRRAIERKPRHDAPVRAASGPEASAEPAGGGGHLRKHPAGRSTWIQPVRCQHCHGDFVPTVRLTTCDPCAERQRQRDHARRHA